MIVTARVIPERLLLMVLKAPNVTDIVAWHAIETDHRVELKEVKDAYSFTPRLSVQYILKGLDSSQYRTVVRFDYIVNRNTVKQWYEVHDFRTQDIIVPKVPFLLADFQINNRRESHTNPLVGMWKIATHVAFVQGSRVSVLPPQPRQQMYFDALRLTFKEVATFEFEVIGVQSLVDSGGTLIRPRGQMIQVAEYAIDEI